MRKEEYLQIFLNALEPLTDSEKEQLRDYYEEMICDGLEHGLTEEECVAQFGDPLEAAAQFREENGMDSSSVKPKADIVPTTPPAGGFHTLNLTAEDTRVVIEPRQEPDFRIEFTPNPERDIVESEEQDGVWYFRHKIKKRPFRNFFGFFRQSDAVITIQVPTSFMGTLLIQTSNAKINCASIQGLPQISLITTNGQIEAENSSMDQLFCKTTNSNITLRNLQPIHTGTLEAVTSNGQIHASDLRFEEIQGKTSNASVRLTQITSKQLDIRTSNGRIDATNCFAQSQISLATSNSSVKVEDLTADTLTITSSNGTLHVQNLSGNQITLSTTNSSIIGTVRGDMREYATESSTTNGSSNIPNLHYPDQTKHFTATTTNGKIQVEFQP